MNEIASMVSSYVVLLATFPKRLRSFLPRIQSPPVSPLNTAPTQRSLPGETFPSYRMKNEVENVLRYKPYDLTIGSKVPSIRSETYIHIQVIDQKLNTSTKIKAHLNLLRTREGVKPVSRLGR